MLERQKSVNKQFRHKREKYKRVMLGQKFVNTIDVCEKYDEKSLCYLLRAFSRLPSGERSPRGRDEFATGTSKMIRGWLSPDRRKRIKRDGGSTHPFWWRRRRWRRRGRRRGRAQSWRSIARRTRSRSSPRHFRKRVHHRRRSRRRAEAAQPSHAGCLSLSLCLFLAVCLSLPRSPFFLSPFLSSVRGGGRVKSHQAHAHTFSARDCILLEIIKIGEQDLFPIFTSAGESPIRLRERQVRARGIN